MAIRYMGAREPKGRNVVWKIIKDAQGRQISSQLAERQDLRNHSPDGFEWGYQGSGPSQLALALLADFLGNDLKALELYQDFKWSVIARIESDYWVLSDVEIADALRDIQEGLK